MYINFLNFDNVQKLDNAVYVSTFIRFYEHIIVSLKFFGEEALFWNLSEGKLTFRSHDRKLRIGNWETVRTYVLYHYVKFQNYQ